MTRAEGYTAFVGYEHRKKYAQFFTPAAIARFIINALFQAPRVLGVGSTEYCQAQCESERFS